MKPSPVFSLTAAQSCSDMPIGRPAVRTSEAGAVAHPECHAERVARDRAATRPKAELETLAELEPELAEGAR